MAELQYGRIPELEKQLASVEKAEKKNRHWFRDKDTPEEIAEVVSRWTI